MESILRAHQIVEDAIKIYNKSADQKTIEMMAKMGLGAKEIKEIATKAPVERNTPKGLYLANSDAWIDAGFRSSATAACRRRRCCCCGS